MRSIFVVDDDPSLRTTVADMLRDEGHNVTEFATVKEALGALQSGALAAAIVTDRHLETRDAGLKLLETANDQQIPAILITGDAPLSPAELIAAGGPRAKQLSKPFGFNALMNALGAVVSVSQSR